MIIIQKYISISCFVKSICDAINFFIQKNIYMSEINYKSEWDFSFLYKSVDDPQIEKDLENQKILVQEFCDKYKNNQEFLQNDQKLYEAIYDYDKLLESVKDWWNAWSYFYYLSTKDTDNAFLQAKNNKIQELFVTFANQLAFFELELSKSSSVKQEEFLQSSKLIIFRNWLKCIFRDGTFALSEKEEIVINELWKVSYSNRENMTEKLLSNETANINIDNNTVNKTFEELMKLSSDQDINTRDEAVKIVNNIFAKIISVSEIELNSVLEYKKNIDNLRKISRPDLGRIYNDDLDESIVDTLNDTVIKRFDISSRYFDLKAKIMKKDKISYNERNLSLSQNDEKIDIKDAINLIWDVFSEIDSEFYDIYKSVLEDGRVDIFPSKGKRWWAFCAWSIKWKSLVFLNYTSRTRDLMTIAHEFGHAIHHEMLKNNESLNTQVWMFVAETPSTFCEDFVFQKLINWKNEEDKFNLLFERLGDQISTIQRQIACYNFEKELHSSFREKWYLWREEIWWLFAKWMSAYCGDSVDCQNWFENRRIHWSHIRSYFYVYAYAGGLLISKSLQALVKKDKNNIQKVKDFFVVWSKQSPKDTFMNLWIDISSSDFWNQWLDEMEKDLIECETLAKNLGKI